MFIVKRKVSVLTKFWNTRVAQDAYEPEQSPRKRQKYEAPRTPDVSDTTWKKQTGLLGQLPLELVLRMFGFLSAEDLAVSAQACRYLASVSSQDDLWKRLYCARYAVSFCLRFGNDCGFASKS